MPRRQGSESQGEKLRHVAAKGRVRLVLYGRSACDDFSYWPYCLVALTELLHGAFTQLLRIHHTSINTAGDSILHPLGEHPDLYPSRALPPPPSLPLSTPPPPSPSPLLFLPPP